MPKTGTLERIPKWLNLIPLVSQWLWLALRYRSLTLPSCTNPSLTSGGLVGEGKMEYLNIMGASALAYTATTTSVSVHGISSLNEVEEALTRSGLTYPVIVKPDLGWCGYGVRRVDDRDQLKQYLAEYPSGESLVLQQWLRHEGEAGIFYMRGADENNGRVIGMVLRHYPRVVGDGVHSLADLIAADPRASRLGRDGASESCCDLSAVPPAGSVVRVATVGSTRVGGGYEDGSAFVTPSLTQTIDGIAKDMKDFHVGRFDVKYSDLASLSSGAGFSIIEVNGAGSEAVHAWDPSLTLCRAYGIIFEKQRRLFAIGHEMRLRGHRPVGPLALLRHHLRQQSLIARYPRSN